MYRTPQLPSLRFRRNLLNLLPLVDFSIPSPEPELVAGMLVLLVLCAIKLSNCDTMKTKNMALLALSVVGLAMESPPSVVLSSCTQALHSHTSMVWLSSSALGQGLLGRLLAVSFSLCLSRL